MKRRRFDVSDVIECNLPEKGKFKRMNQWKEQISDSLSSVIKLCSNFWKREKDAVTDSRLNWIFDYVKIASEMERMNEIEYLMRPARREANKVPY